MANNELQETLDRLLEELRSNDVTRCLHAIQELKELHYSSEAIVLQLERLALKGEVAVQEAALAALSFKTSQVVASRLSPHTKFYRNLILKEIDEWQEDEIIDPHQAEVLRRHYDFDIKRPVSDQVPAGQIVLAPKIRQSRSEKGSEQSAEPGVQPSTTPAGPRPSLTQTLLSEASIKVYLYLGAFFVIASALILAALVEAARLPILAAATLAFGVGAFLLRKRLPQPSFALFIVFSFLLPIDANVLEETIGLTEPVLSSYWTVLFLMMAVIWGLSVWFYGSRLFSIVAFISLSLAFYRVGVLFDTELELQIFLGLLASFMGLGGAFVLRRWKDTKFSLPLFSIAHLQVLGLLFASLGASATHMFDSDFSRGWWLLISLTWLAAASFYVFSDIVIPFPFFPWMTVAALLPLPWFFLSAFDATQTGYASGFWVWAAVLALASEAALNLSSEQTRKFHWPLLAGSAGLFLVSFSIALFSYLENPIPAFAVFGFTAFVYAGLHIVRPRWYVWSAALFSAVSSYLIFFDRPIIAGLEIPLVFQLLIASLFFVVPELFIKSPLTLRSATRQPLIIFGVFLSLFALAIGLADFDEAGRSAAVLIVYALLFTLHAVHAKQTWLGYLATASGSLAVVYALQHFGLDPWLPTLTVLSVVYYTAGFFLRRAHDGRLWGNVLIDSGLTLGALLSLTSLVLFAESSGWYIIIIALLFIVEIFARPLKWLEVVIEVLLSISFYLILYDFNVPSAGHFPFGLSLIWLGSDLIFDRLIKEKRPYRSIPLFVGYILVFISALVLWGQSTATLTVIYFSLYVVFFAMYSFLQRESRLGYISATFLPLAVIKYCEILNFEKWIFPLIFLALLYYAAGYWLRRNQKAQGWDRMFLYSGLGLGVVTSISAPFQGGISASIPVAVAASLFAVEAYVQRNVWWVLPANVLYLESYFIILVELDVEELQFYSIGAALLGMFMHSLLSRAGSKTGAFIAGMLSQFVLLGTTYFQMVSTERLVFFVILFAQGMIVLAYGLIQRSRSLVMTPIAFVVLGVVTVIYTALKGLGTVILIGSAGVVLLLAGIVAVLLRERITRLSEQLSDWRP